MLTSITEIAEGRFQSSSYPCLRKISCVDHGGVLILRGRVSSFFHKQIAQTLVGDIEGVKEVINQIEVIDDEKQ